MKNLVRKFLVLSFIFIFWLVGLGPTPVFAAEALKEWNYQRSLIAPPASANPEKGILDKIKNFFTGDDEEDSKSKNPNIPVHTNSVPEGKVKEKAKRVKELINERKPNAKFHQLSDGKIEAEISPTPIHYKDSSGKWQDIKNTITTSKQDASYGFANTTNSFQTYFGNQSSGSLVKVKSGTHQLEMGLLEAKTIEKQPTVKENQIAYPELKPNMKVEYQMQEDAVKESIIFDRVPDTFAYQFKLNLEGLTATQQKDGSIKVESNQDGRMVFTIPKPFMMDSKPNPQSPYGKEWSPNVTQTIEQKGSEATLTIQADEKWLKDSARQFPVILDPTIIVQPPPTGNTTNSQDTMITNASPDSNFYSSWKLATGTDKEKISRSLVKFDLSSIPAGTSIDAARVELYYDQQFGGDNEVDFSMHRMMQDWDPKTATWNQAQTGVPWNKANGVDTGSYQSSLEYNTEVVDDHDSSNKAVMNGQWGSMRSDSSHDGSFFMSPSGLGSDTFTWIPKLTESGKYELQMWYPAGFATNAPYTVYHANGTTNVSVDQSKDAGKWSTKGTFEFQAGNSNKIVLNNKADSAVYADAMRLIKYSVDTKKKAVGNKTHSFTARSLVQDWINGTQPNFGVMVKAKEEAKKLGGVNYTASSDDFFGQDQDQIRPKLVVTYGKPGVVLDQPTKLHATGAELSWSKYTGGDFVEYQVHRSTEQNFVPDETTLIAPIEKLDQLAYTDTTSPAVPTMGDNNRVNRDPEYYYMIAVKTSDGDLVGTDTKFVRLPKAGQIRQIVKAGKDTSISSGKPTEALDSIWGNNWLVAGNHHARYGDIRSLVHFDTSELPTGVKVTSARMGLWSWLMESEDAKASPASYRVHPLQNDFTEDTNWNTSGKGGSYGPHIDQQKANSEAIPNAPHWTYWDTTSTVQSWLKGTSVNKGLLVKSADELRENGELVYFLSSEASARSLRPQLEVTYTDESAGSSYYAPSTPSVMSPGNDYEVFVTVTNTTDETWRGGSNHLSYHWVDSTGKEIGTSDNQAKTTFRPIDENGIEYPDPVDIKPGQSIKVRAKVIAPTLSSSNLRQEFTLRWDILQDSKNWLSQSEKPVATLNQKIAVEKDKTEKNLGEAATHIKENTGPGSTAGANLFKGNFAYSFTPFKHSTKGFATYATLTYNSLNDQSTIMGKGWSLGTNSMMSIGAPMSNAAQIDTRTDQIVSGSVVLVDDEGSSHTFTYDKNKKKLVPPSGTNLTLQYQSGKGGSIDQRKWIVSASNQTKYYFDREGYVTEVVNRNGNKLTFTYEKKKIDNKDAKILKYMTDTAGRRVMNLTYTSKNQLEYIDDLVGRRTALSYDGDGRLVKIVDGIDKNNNSEALARTYQFTYHATKKNMMTGVIDPKGNKTSVQYIETGTDANKIGEWINRDGKSTYFNYNGNEANVTDAKNRKTRFLFDARGRNISFTNAMNQTTKYAYDDDDNLIRTEEPNGAVSTTTYDPHNHGLPVTKMDPVNNALTDASARKASKSEYKYSDDYTSALLTKATSPEGKTVTYTHDKNGNIISEKDSMGNETKISYYITDAKGKAIDTTDPNASGTNTGLLKTKTDPNGQVTTFGDPTADDLGYDPNGKPKKVKDPMGNTTVYTYGPRGEILTTTDSKGNTTTITYDLLGDIVKTVTPKDQLNRQFITTQGPVFDKNGNALSQTTPTGAETKSEYDKMDRVIKTILPKDDNSTTERTKTFTYNEVGKLVKETEPNGNLTPDNADDFSTSYEHNDLDQVTTITNAKGDQIKQEYDNVGNLIKVTQPLGVLTADPDDYSIKKEYDLNHRVIKEIDAKGKYVQTTYNADGLVTSARDKEGNFKYSYYDARGLLTESRYQHDTDKVRITKYRYDKMGNQTEVETPRGVETPNEGDFVLKKSYDALNRVSETFFSYDPTSVNTRFREQHSIRYKYDSTGNVVEVSTPPTEGSNTRNTATFSYYDNGLIKQIQDPWKTKTNYQYNDIGLETERLVQSADEKMQRKMTWDYYPDGKVKKTYDAGLRTPDSQVFDYKRLEYAYDANGNLVETKDQSTGAKLDTYRMSYTSMNQVSKVEDISKGVVKNKREFEYDRNGNIDSQEDPLTRSMFYYDTMNQVEQLASREAGTKEYQWTKYERTPNGQLSKVTKPNEMTTSYTYYLDALLKEMETKKKDGTTIQKHALEYNANGHRTKDTYTGIDADKEAFNYIYSYQYDPRDRLVEYNKTGTSSSKEQYVLDANSNIISKTKDGVATNYQYDKDRLISETTSGKTKKYEYDSIGRVSQIKADDVTQEEYRYDVFDNIKEHQKLSQKTQYEYDAQDRTIAKTESAGTSSAKKIKYNYLGTGGQVISEEVDGIINRSYTYSAWGERLSMTKKMAQGSETSYYLNNTDVDVEMLLDEQGEVRATYGYSPYGENDEALFSGVDKPDPKDPKKEMYNAYRYSGKPWDPNTKSYDLGFRNYFPEVGRYLTADSYTDSEKYRGLLMDAQNYNMYGFTNGNPISYHDPDGHAMLGSDGERAFYGSSGNLVISGSRDDNVNGIHKWNKRKGTYERISDLSGNRIKKSKNPTKQRTQHPPKVKSMNRKLWDQTTEVFIGVWDGGADFVGGIWNAVTHPLETIEGIKAAVEDPTLIWESIIDPIRSRWRQGKYGQAVGYSLFSIAEAAAGSKGATKLGKVGKACFVAGTLIQAADGEKPIEDIQVGDKVLSKDEKTGKREYKKVTRLFKREVDKIYTVHVGKEKIETTAEHPFWVKGKGWVPAKGLQEGDLLEDENGKALPVEKISIKNEKTTVYNFEVEDYHTYYVSDTGIWVHNMCDLTDQVTRKQMFNQAKNDAGIPTSSSPIKQGWINVYGGGERARVYQFEGTDRHIIEHRNDKFGRGLHFHVGVPKDPNVGLFTDGTRYYNLGKIEGSGIQGHYPENKRGFRE